MTSSTRLDWTAACRTLGLRDTAGIADIKRRFRELARKYHPDTFISPLDKLIATKRFQPIAEAYSFLLRSAKERPGEARAQGSATSFDSGWTVPPPYPGYEKPEDRVSMWTVVEGLKARYPWLVWTEDILLGPAFISGVLICAPLLLLSHFLSPRLRHVAVVIGLRWGPIVAGIYMGYVFVGTPWGHSQGVGSRLFGALVLLSGVVSLVLEVVAQVFAAKDAPARKASLEHMLSDIRALERAV